ncbi:MAG TPA: tetratricopeptide repeat protein [Bacteroidota bacterium]|nr:tetratricopeptide repeat protein [Bacteroidota bacterium]
MAASGANFLKVASIVLVVAAAMIAFHAVLDCGFLTYDDIGYVTGNSQVRSGISLQTFLWSFKSTEQGNWHPLTWLSHALDCTLFGLNPAYHHATNLALHLISSVLLLLFFAKATGDIWQSSFIALVFAVHPLHVESVAWIAERKDVLSALFWILGMHTYLRYRVSKERSWYMITLLMFALGLLAKPMLITFPFALMLLDFWPFQSITLEGTTGAVRRGAVSKSFREKIPFFLLTIGSSLITFLVQKAGGSMAEADKLPLPVRAANAVLASLQYIRKTFWPDDLAVFYPHPGNNVSLVYGFAGAAALVAVTYAVWKQRAKQPYLIVGWLWFLGTLVPVIGLVQVGLQSMADRYMYLPIIGLAVMFAWGLTGLFAKLRLPRFAPHTAFLAISCAMVVTTLGQVNYWKTSASLFEHALAVTQDNHLAHHNLGVLLADSGRHEEAIAHLREALRLRPDEPLIHRNLARSLAATGRNREAIEQYQWLLSRTPSDAALHARMGNILADDGNTNEAISHFRQALQLNSGDVTVRLNLAELYLRISRLDEARVECMQALKQEPKDSRAHDLLGIIAGKMERFDDARAEFFRAIRFDSSNSRAYTDLGILYEHMGRADSAESVLEDAVRINPRDPNLELDFGMFLARSNKLERAGLHWIRALQLDPSNADVHFNLGKLYVLQGDYRDATTEFTNALRINPKHLLAHFNYAKLLEKEGDLAGAERHYNEALRIAPDFQAAAAGIKSIRDKKESKQ